MNVALVDSGVANLTSVVAAFARLGIDAQVTADAALIGAADRVVLPGVGSAPAAMRMLDERGLIAVLRSLRQPVLGICLGMQLMFEISEEGGQTACLGLIPGAVRKMKIGAEPLPHMGWNEIEPRGDHSLLRDVPAGSFMYFVHSYAAPVSDMTLASCVYGEAFSAMVGHKNFFGCQFHPERSGAMGQQILRNFIEMKT